MSVQTGDKAPKFKRPTDGGGECALADFKGKRLRALGGMGRAAKAIGAVPERLGVTS